MITIKKTLAALMICCAAAGIANAESNSDSYWGVRVTLDANIPGKWHPKGADSFRMYKNGAGFSAGAVYHLAFNYGLFFEPGVNLYYDTYRYDDIIIDAKDNRTVNPTVGTFGVRVPLNVGFSYPISDVLTGSFFTGPELDLGITSRLSGNGTKYDSPDLNNYSNGIFRRFDCAWTIGIGAEFFRNYYFSVSGSLGMVNLLKNSNVTFRENAVRVTLGYNF